VKKFTRIIVLQIAELAIYISFLMGKTMLEKQSLAKMEMIL
jgi:hypothetical protein